MRELPENEAEIAAAIISLERKALDRWGKGDPSGFLEISAPDVVYFDPFVERRVDGIEELTRLYERYRGQVKLAGYELLNPNVQWIGDAAVLTFNFFSRDDDGTESRWNCTEVYRRGSEGWRIVQTHWALTQAGLRRSF
jgi:hypothetical protein